MRYLLSISVFLLLVWLAGCGDSLPVDQDLSNKNYELLNQDSVNVNYPEIVKGKIAVIGYVFTNCPDICPLTTYNMQWVQKKIKENGIKNVEFVTISFDPEFDTPTVLKNYAQVRNIDMSNWIFLTGDKDVTDQLIKDVGVVAAVSDSREMKNGQQIHLYVHTDRINLMDQEGRIRAAYLGSKLDTTKIINDIKTLED